MMSRDIAAYERSLTVEDFRKIQRVYGFEESETFGYLFTDPIKRAVAIDFAKSKGIHIR